jgi:hypothetical protein
VLMDSSNPTAMIGAAWASLFVAECMYLFLQ